jgi:allophanate hydrolase subunit 2
VLGVLPGPRRDRLAADAWSLLTAADWTVCRDSDRVGLRLAGPVLRRATEDELPSEGLVPGAVQVPPDGAPVLFLADHPVTGGYPVVGYVADDDVDRCAQLRPGQALRFRPGQPG